MYSDFHFYIDLNWEDAVEKTLDVYLKELYQLVELAYQHKATVFYCQKYLQEFVKQITDLDSCFSSSIGNKIQMIIENAKEQNNEFYAFELCFAKENTTIHYINNILSFVDEHDKIAIFTHSNTIINFLLVKSVSDYCIIECDNITKKENLVKWIVAKKPRIFNSSYHGQQGKGNWVTKSSLLCSKERAQQLLNEAIPCFMDRDVKRRIYNYDPDNDAFIEFFHEGNNPQNQWHGFHICKDKWNGIPEYILKYFNKYT